MASKKMKKMKGIKGRRYCDGFPKLGEGAKNGSESLKLTSAHTK